MACTTELAYVMASAPESVRARRFIKMLDEKSVLQRKIELLVDFEYVERHVAEKLLDSSWRMGWI